MHGKQLPWARGMGKAGLCLPVREVSSIQCKNKDAQERQKERKGPGDVAESSAC